MSDEKSLNVIKPTPEEKNISPEEKARLKLSRTLDMKRAELGYHNQSISQIGNIVGFINKTPITGEQAITLAECLHWLKGVKTNVKNQSEVVRDEISKFEKELKGGSNGNTNKKA